MNQLNEKWFKKKYWVLLVCLIFLGDVKADTPKILSTIFGYARCLGVESIADAISLGCVHDNITDCKTGKTSTVTNAVTTTALTLFCRGQPLKNKTHQDATPVTFNFPVDPNSVKAEHFLWHLNNGKTVVPGCATLRPANEKNEYQTVLIIGDVGHQDGPGIERLEVVGDLMLLVGDGQYVSAKGLSYSGEQLNYSSSVILHTARLEVFSTIGETLKNPPISPKKPFPNHCRQLFPKTTHRLRLLFSGGVTLDGLIPITPNRTDLFRLNDVNGKELPAETILGLADLGHTNPTPACVETYETDGDNYVDICLQLQNTTNGLRIQPTSVSTICTSESPMCPPKGIKYLCSPQTVPVIMT